MMKEPKAEISIFYCTHQGERVDRVVKGLNESGELTIRRVGLPCSGKLEVFQLLKALEGGADGVVLFGCPETACRYMVGSTRAKGRVSHTGKLLEGIGLEKERVRRFVFGGQAPEETLGELASWVQKVKALRPISSAAKDRSVPLHEGEGLRASHSMVAKLKGQSHRWRDRPFNRAATSGRPYNIFAG